MKRSRARARRNVNIILFIGIILCIVGSVKLVAAEVGKRAAEKEIAAVVIPTKSQLHTTVTKQKNIGAKTIEAIDLPKTKEKMVALTFDDGPSSNGTTELVLDLLKANNAKGTFFMLGERVVQNPAAVERIYKEGHELGSHSWSHPQLTKLSGSQVKKQINDTDAAVKKITGTIPTVFRPPYGAINDAVKALMHTPSIMWSMDTLDWKHKDANYVANYILDHVKDGDIILTHDIHATTGEAMKKVIPELQRRGYKLVTVSELMLEKGIVMNNGTNYFGAN